MISLLVTRLSLRIRLQLNIDEIEIIDEIAPALTPEQWTYLEPIDIFDWAGNLDSIAN